MGAAPAETDLARMRAADIAEALNRLTPAQAAGVLSALPSNLAVQVLDVPEFDHHYAVFPAFSDDKARAFLEGMSGDRVADVVRSLAEPDAKRLIAMLSPDTSQAITLLLQYPPGTAGGIMTTEVVTLPSRWTVQRALDHVIAVSRQKETIYATYVVDEATGRLQSAVSLKDLLTADPGVEVSTIHPHLQALAVAPTCGRDEAARLISKYNLLAVPVVDADRCVLGVVTVDDVLDALVQELTEDVQKFGGMEALDQPYDKIGFTEMIRKRAGWLCALFLGEMLTATAMGFFEGEISRATVLALFIPLIISSGGNSGSQATSIIIRSMALRQLSVADWFRVAVRELPSGVALGTILGCIGVMRILAWQALGWYDYGPHYLRVALTVGCALIGVVTFGSMAGSMLPFALRKLGVDPASASAPFVATLVDVTGLVIYFSVAWLLLRGTLL